MIDLNNPVQMSDAAEISDIDRITIDGPMFYLVHGCRAGYDDFTVEGVFSRRDDADEWVKALESLPYMQAVARPQRLPLKTVIDLLIRDRLGKLADSLNSAASAKV